MAGPLEQAGAVREPSEYAALAMDRAITGLWTQRSPLRDADVPYLYGKFYSASRFDSLIDGINREVSADLTYRRRFGNSVYNSNTFPAIKSFYPFRRTVNGTELIRVMADGADGVIYDATAGGKISVFTKSGGAGKARFAAANTSLYFADGVDNKKWLQPGTWLAQTSMATTQYAVGTYILDNETPTPKLQYLTSVQVGTVTKVQVAANVVSITFSATGFNIVPGMSFRIQGITPATFLTNVLLIATTVNTISGGFVVTATFPYLPQASTVQTAGTAFTNDIGTLATTGASQPTWNTSTGGSTTDGISTWVNYGNPLYDWGPPAAPTAAPTLAPLPSFSFYASCALTLWQPNTIIGNATMGMMALLDANGFIQASNNVTSFASGPSYPNFQPPASTNLGSNSLQDGQINWNACYWFGSAFGGAVGSGFAIILAPGPASWQATTAPINVGTGLGDVLLDTNGNLQMVTAKTGTNKSGATVPTWNVTYGGTTPDGGLTWTNLGPYLAIAFRGDEYAFAYHCVDGSVSTLSPMTESTHGSANGVGGVQGPGSGNPSCDSVWIFRTVDGIPSPQSTPLFLASVPNPGGSGTFTFWDFQSDQALDALIVGPQSEANNPPPIGMTAPLYHFGRIWAIDENNVICSGGPDTLVGNGNTSFPPGNAFPIPEQPIRLFPIITSAGQGILVWGRANSYVILGNGTPSAPFQQAALYMANTGILNYDAVTQIGSTFYAFGASSLVGNNVVGKAFSLDPATGYVEYGFPIGDQFQNVTTGAGGKNPASPPLGYLYNPASSYVTWAELGSADTGLYVSDGSVGWFRYSPIASPESGFLWSPRAVIAGGTSAVQGVETQPGITQLLIGPKTSGPILFRDSTVSTDNGTAFPSYDVKGCIQLCLSGEVAEVAHVHLVSAAVGARPLVGLLFGEILPTVAAPFYWYEPTTGDPPDLKRSETVYSDRYSMLQNSVTPKCLFFQLGMDYGTQNAADETLMFTVYGAKFAERKQQ